MVRRPPRSTLTDTHFPYTTLVRSVAILQLLERCIETSDAVEKKLGVMSLGSIPDTASLPEFDKEEAALPPTQMVVDRPQSSFADAFRRLRTSIHFARPDQQSTIIAVPSSLPGEGKRSEERRVGQECVSTCRSGWAPYP